MLKKILIGLAAIIAIVLIAGLVIWNLPEENVAKKSVDYKVAATGLFEEYTANEEAGNAKYIGKIIQVSGIIEDLSKDEKGDDVVLIAGDDMGSGVLCSLEPSESSKIGHYKRGDTITVKGRCTGMLMDVVMNKCTIVE